MGNKNSGRKKSNRAIAQEALKKALDKVAYQKSGKEGIDGIAYFLEHYIQRAFATPSLAQSLAKKLLPDLSDTKTEHDGSLVDQSLNYTIKVVKADGSENTVAQQSIRRMD